MPLVRLAIVLLLSLPFVSQTPTVSTIARPTGVTATPGGLAIDADGNIYTADFGGSSLVRIAADGTIRALAHRFFAPAGNAIDSIGNLYQSNYRDRARPNEPDSITRVTPEGRVTAYATGLDGPAGIAVADDGTLFVDMCDANEVWTVDPDGNAKRFSSSRLFDCPNGITFDDRGDLYVVNIKDGKVIRVRPDGAASLLVETPGGANAHVVFVAGSLYVTNMDGHRIYRIQLPSGDVSVFAGTGEPGAVDGALETAQFDRPNAIARNVEGTALFVNQHGGVVRRIDLRGPTEVP